MANPTCTVQDCAKPARSALAELCPMHYHRKYRHGDVNALPSKIKTAPEGDYRQVNGKGHPLANKQGRVYEHRKVLFDAIGPGEHQCHWCHATVAWLPYGTPGFLFVDHINERKDDNRLANLVPSCDSCNVARSAARRARVLREAGAWSVNDTIADLRGFTGRKSERFSSMFT